MTKTNYTDLIESLKTIRRGNSESDNRRGMEDTLIMVRSSELSDEGKASLISTIKQEANPTGWYYTNNGTGAAIAALEVMAEKVETPENGNTESQSGFNYRNLKALVSGGQIFSVEFIKRTTGELRKMKCRVGVKAYLRGGRSSYQAKSKGLLTVFDMEAKGYRSIPVEAIKRLSVGGQTFQFGEV